jgi:hypothetical protein
VRKKGDGHRATPNPARSTLPQDSLSPK